MGEGAPAVSVVNATSGARLLESGPQRLAVEIAGDDLQVSSLLRSLVLGGIGVVRFDHRTVDLEERYRRAFGDKH
jgi:hypothetical protein